MDENSGRKMSVQENRWRVVSAWLRLLDHQMKGNFPQMLRRTRPYSAAWANARDCLQSQPTIQMDRSIIQNPMYQGSNWLKYVQTNSGEQALDGGSAFLKSSYSHPVAQGGIYQKILKGSINDSA